jgi:gliding motility-associated-like protein
LKVTNTSLYPTHHVWYFGTGDSSLVKNPNYNYEYLGNAIDTVYTLRYIGSIQENNQTICADTFMQNIRIYPIPIAQISNNDTAICSGASIEFTHISQKYDSITWHFGDGTTANSDAATKQFWNNLATEKIFTVVLEAKNAFGCTHYDTIQVTVAPALSVQFVSSETKVCHNSPVTFNANIAFGATNFVWNFGNGQTANNVLTPTVQFTNNSNNDTNFVVTLTAFGNNVACATTFMDTVTVYRKLNVEIISNVEAGCTQFDVNFTATPMNLSNYQWFFGNGTAQNTTNTNITHTFVNGSNTVMNNNVILIGTDSRGCKDTTQKIITAYPQITANFTADTSGCSPLSVAFTNISLNATNYIWDFGNGVTSTAVNPSQVFVNNGLEDILFTVKLTAINGVCQAEKLRNIRVASVPQAAFSVTPETMIYPENSVTIVNQTAITANQTYQWNFGDGNSSTTNAPNFNHNFVLPTNDSLVVNYVITLTVDRSGCQNSVSKTVTILPRRAKASFELVGENTGCPPFVATFRNNSRLAISYHWDFGDGRTSSEAEPTHIYRNAGVYSVKLTVKGISGQDDTTITNLITVHERPTARFEVAPDKRIVFTPDEATELINYSLGATRYLWFFGDGGIDSTENPKYAYSIEGLYDITLIAFNDFNCADTMLFRNAVEANKGNKYRIPNAFSPDEDGLNDIFRPIAAGVVTFEMRIYNRWGQLILVTEDMQKGWDGKYNGQYCPQGAYPYVIYLQFSDGTEKRIMGDVTLLR